MPSRLSEAGFDRYRRAGVDGDDEPSHDGRGSAMIVGPGGLEGRKDIWIGCSLLPPDIRYAMYAVEEPLLAGGYLLVDER